MLVINSKIILPPLIIAALLSCEKSPDAAGKDTSAQAASPVRAWVNQTAITQTQLDYALERITGGAIVPLDNAVHKKVLDSVVSSRAMSLLAEEGMSAKDKERLELQVQAYREELLTKAYINQHATPEPVTSDMVEQYYFDHLDEFGGKEVKSFEYITSVGALDDDVRKALLQRLENLMRDPKADLQKAVASLRQDGYVVKYKAAEMSVELVQEPIKGLLQQTKSSEFSPIFDQTDQIVLLRVNSSKTMDAKALSEVAADIRKKLAPLQLKKSIKDLVERAKQQVEIKYEGTGD